MNIIKKNWLVLLCLFISIPVLILLILNYLYRNVETYKFNVDINKDSVADINLDPYSTGICFSNCDINSDKKPDTNISRAGRNKPTFNLDLNDDGKPDVNPINIKDINGICIRNCDIDNDGWPDTLLDLDNDGVVDIETDTYEVINELPTIKDISNDDNAHIIEYISDDPINGMNVSPGYKGVRKFRVINRSNLLAAYTLYWDEVYNTFTSDNFKYSLKKDGIYIVYKKTVPKDNYVNAYELPIVITRATHEYELELMLENTHQDQSNDMDKVFEGRIQVKIN